jgi:hypothetical protein
MSHSQTVAQPKNAKMDRLLDAIGLSGKSKPARNSPSSILQQEEWTYRTEDLAPEVGSGLTRIQLIGELVIEVRVTLTAEGSAQNKKNDLFATDVQKIVKAFLAKKKSAEAAHMAKVLSDVDQNSQISQRQVQQTFEKYCVAVGNLSSVELTNQVNSYISSNKAIKIAYRTYQFKCFTTVVTSTVAIAGGIAATAASFGATAPVAIIAIVRSCVGMGQAVYEMTKSADAVMKDIEDTFITIDAIYTKIDSNTKNPEWAKALNSAVEAGIGVLTGLLNFQFPSVETIKEKLKTLENKLAGLHVQRQNIGKEITAAKSAIEKYRQEVEKQRNGPVSDLKKIALANANIKIFEEACVRLREAAETMFKDISAAIVRQAEFKANLKTYKASMYKYVGKTSMVVGSSTALGLGVGAGGNGIEQGLGGLVECLNFLLERIKDKL